MKKFLSFMLSALMITSLGVTAFAAETTATAQPQTKDYQEVIDKLNNEYGLDAHFATAEEYSALGIKSPAPNVTLEEFESQMRKDIEASIKANEEARLESQKLKSVRVEKSGSGTCEGLNFEESLKASNTVTRKKNIAGATAHLRATVNNTAGYWRYSNINKAWTTYTAGYNSTPAFAARTYNYNLIDARRTCALSLYGYTVGNWGVIIDNNAYRYVEFWAGSGM